MAISKARILVVDDEQGIRDMLRSELSAMGYSVETAPNGENALEKIEQSKFDIVISDIKMPKFDGLQVLEAVKKTSPETEVIMITGYATVENSVQAMKNGAYDFLQKPFNLEELGALIEKALEKSELKTLLALHESSKAIFSTLRLEELFPVMINLLKNVVRADETALLLFDNQSQLYLAAASFSLVYYPHKDAFVTLAERIHASDASRDQSLVIKASQPGNPLVEGLFGNGEIKSLAAYPLKLQDRNLGMLVVAKTSSSSDFSSADMRNLSIFVSQIAQSIANTKLYEKLEIKVSELENAHRQLAQARKQLILAEKMSAAGQMSAVIAHQLKSPLHTVTESIDAALKKNGIPPDVRMSIAKIKDETERCQEIVRNLLLFASYHKTRPVPANINDIIEETLELVEYEFRKDNIKAVLELDAALPRIKVDVSQMKQVFLNLLINAQQSFSGRDEKKKSDKVVLIRTTQSEGRLTAVVSDSGCGMDPKTIDRVFDPFFTTKDPEHNMGLGLSISYAIIEQHKGTIIAENSPRGGALFTLTLPSR
ncbi:MAG: response regulator [Endomicrobiales bacterium]